MFEHTHMAVVAVATLAFCACSGGEPAQQSEDPVDEASAADSVRNMTTEPEVQSPALGDGPSAVARLAPTEGREATGLVSFAMVEGEGRVRIEGEFDNLPAGPHGFHIHENGDCSAADASSAGGHFAPDGSPHGAPDDPASERHMGDLGNLEANAEGYAEYDRVDAVLALDGPGSIVGKAVIVHEMADDLESQPSGAAGPRIACGVIEPDSPA